MRHRIANSLQIIASILLLKAASVESKESKQHLEDAHERIMSIAAVQEQLDTVGTGTTVSGGVYLTNLCKSLSRSMIGGRKPITLEVKAGPGNINTDTAVSLGLVTIELVINALKHAFPDGQAGAVVVSFSTEGTGWNLSVSDNGVGKSVEAKSGGQGLGTSLVSALAEQLHATVTSDSSRLGTKVSVVLPA
jgi:chemotaxis protein methyltransferase CheR